MKKWILIPILLIGLVQCGESKDELSELKIGVKPNVSPLLPGSTRNCTDQSTDFGGDILTRSVDEYWVKFPTFFVLWAKLGYDLYITEIQLTLSGGPINGRFRSSIVGEELEFLLGAPGGLISAPQETTDFLCDDQFESHTYCTGRFSNISNVGTRSGGESTNFDKRNVGEFPSQDCSLIFGSIPISKDIFDTSFALQGELAVYGYASRTESTGKESDLLPFVRRLPVKVQNQR